MTIRRDPLGASRRGRIAPRADARQPWTAAAATSHNPSSDRPSHAADVTPCASAGRLPGNRLAEKPRNPALPHEDRRQLVYLAGSLSCA